MPTVAETLTAAANHHRAGRLQQARRMYGEVLRLDPRHPDALHLSGVAAHQSGDSESATKRFLKQPHTAAAMIGRSAP